jgi:glutamyl-tRNA reductase
MMEILNIGMNHETAPVALRECLAGDMENAGKALMTMRDVSCIKEGLFLSTCNRVEALCTTDDSGEASRAIVSIMARLGSLPENEFVSSLFTYRDAAAVQHIFRVASSLDSMVVGEPQILGQIKEAYALAAREKTSGVIINRMMHRAFHVAKRIRTETGIADAAVSISYAAVELAKKIFYELEGKQVLLIGAGEMAELAARHLMGNGITSLAVANRTFQSAVQVAEAMGGKAVTFDEIDARLLDVDIVISSTASTEYVIGYDQVKRSLRKRRSRPLFFIDIAVPRDVEPRVNDLGNTYVYDIDDLKGIVDINVEQRRQEAVKAERIIQEEVIKFEKWLKTLDVVPTIVSLKEKAEAIRRSEMKKSLGGFKGLSPEQMQLLEALTQSIAEKIINDPILLLKRKADRSTRDSYLDMARQLFKLDQDDEERS